MARHPDKPVLSYEDHQLVQKLADNYSDISESLPTVKWHAPIIYALIARLDRIDSKDADYCAQEIKRMAAFEVVENHSREEIDVEMRRQLAELVYGKPSRQTHDPASMDIQREMIIDYLMREKYPRDARNPESIIGWLAKHWERIIDIISVKQCWCNYNVEFDALLRLAKKEKARHDWRGRANTADLILANLHCSTLSNIQRLLKSSS